MEIGRSELFPWGWDAAHRAQHVLVVGATGAVGRELVRLLLEAGHPPERLHLVARRATSFRFRERSVAVEAVAGGELPRAELAFLCTPASVARSLVPRLTDAGTRVVDLSSAHRGDLEVPLVVPEVNGDLLGAFTPLVAGPNCTAAIASLPLAGLQRAFGLREVVLTSYQAASGAGREGVVRLLREEKGGVDRETDPGPFPAPLARNVIPSIGAVDEEGWCDEERKVVGELRRLLGRSDLPVDATTVRVPVERCHSVALSVVVERAVGPEEVRTALEAVPGVRLDPDPAGPRPLDRVGTDLVHVGRIRTGARGERSLSCFAVGDQLRKGAALNALQIAAALPVA